MLEMRKVSSNPTKKSYFYLFNDNLKLDKFCCSLGIIRKMSRTRTRRRRKEIQLMFHGMVLNIPHEAYFFAESKMIFFSARKTPTPCAPARAATWPGTAVAPASRPTGRGTGSCTRRLRSRGRCWWRTPRGTGWTASSKE